MAINEIDALKAIDDALSQLDNDERTRVLGWANNKYGNGAVIAQSSRSVTANPPSNPNPTETKPKTRRSKSSSASKSSSSLKQLKELKFSPSGKKSFSEFIDEKKPTNQKQKCTAAVYYMANMMEIDSISPNHVYTAFKAAKWPIPSNLINTMHQAGTEGWLDTEDATAIKVTHIGENLIEHELPKTSK